MTTITVNTSAALSAALKAARPGDTIALAAGEYSNISMMGLNFVSNVTITSADPGHPAVLTDLTVRDSSGLTFTNLTMSAKSDVATFSFTVTDSKWIAFDLVDVHGVTGVTSQNAQSALIIRGSTDVAVTNSAFHDLRYGLSLLDNGGVKVAGNYFHDIRTDGVRGGGNSNVSIANNLFTDFYPAAGDHPDAVQLWTTNTNTSAHDISIQDNVVLRGNGDPIQGIFLRDQVGNLPYQNVNIGGNIVVGGSYNGIFVDGVVGGVIENNTVLGDGDQKSWIRAQADFGLIVSLNVATDFSLADGTDPTESNEYALQLNGNGAGWVRGWLADHDDFAGVWGGASAVAELLRLPASVPLNVSPLVTVSGTDGADRLTADARFDSYVDGGAGNDALTGVAGHTATLVGGEGDDTYILKSNTDIVVEQGNGGYDTVSVGFDYTLFDNVEAMRMTGVDLIGTGNALDNRIVGGAGNDQIFGLNGDDTLQGGDGNDWVEGGNGNDMLLGYAGNDTLLGGQGNDTLLGGDGNDSIDGGDGADLIEGGVGNDVMRGGAGADVFRWRAEDPTGGQQDTIVDFRAGEDLMNLRGIDANVKTVADDAFKFIGTSDFHGIAGELRFIYSGADTIVYADTDGDKAADFSFLLKDIHGLTASDFVL